MEVQYHRTVTNVDPIVDEVQLAIPEAPIDLVEHHAKRSLVDFCRESHYWRENVGPVTVTAATNSFDIPVSRYQRAITIHHIEATKGDEKRTLQRSQDTSVKFRFWQYSDFAFEIQPHDELVGYSLSIIASLEPVLVGSTKSIRVSESVLTAWHDGLVAGAISRIKRIPGKPWTDMATAGDYASMARQEAYTARIEAARGYSGAPDKPVNKPRKFY